MSTTSPDFEPLRLRAAVARATLLHPNTRQSPAFVPAEGLPALRRRVVAAKQREGGLDSLAAELRPREVRTLFTCLLLWEDLRAELLVMLRHRVRPSHAPFLWTTWQRAPGLSQLVELITALPPDSWKFLPVPFSSLVPSWIASPKPGVAVIEWLKANHHIRDDLPRFGGLGLLQDAPFARIVHEAVLTDGSRAQLSAEPVGATVAMAREMDVNGSRREFAWNYLRAIPVDEWRVPVLDEIRRSYGLPRRARIGGFWEFVPQTTQDEFQRFFIERELARAFGEGSERQVYWRRWMSEFDDVHRGTARGVEFAILFFEGFGVVEFFQLGHAAYFYDLKTAEEFANGHLSGPEGLKDVARGRRLIHRGKWQPKADRMVGRRLRRGR